MGTTWAEVICDFAMPIIDDVRLSDQLASQPALFFRRMSIYVKWALPMLSRPPELSAYLNKGLSEPEFADFTWVSTEESVTESVVVRTDLVGYEIFSCVLRSRDSAGDVHEIPVSGVTYDSETGDVTFPIQESAGLEYSLDFYSDGSFGADLSSALKRLIGLGMAIAWDERFNRNWLNLQPKADDSSFDVGNEATQTRAYKERLSENIGQFNDDLRRYEQDLAYSNALSRRQGISFV